MKHLKMWAAGVLAALAIAGLAGCGATGKEGSSVQQNMNPEALRQVVAADNEHGRTIMWQLPQKVDAAVEYREKGSDQTEKTPASSKAYKGNRGVADSYVYTVRLKGLKPGTTYEYRTRTGDSVSAWNTLKTDNGGPFKALVFSDSQSSDYSDWANLFKTATGNNPDAQFFADIGDIVDNGDDEYQWSTWFKSVAGEISQIPVSPVIGNHECYSLDWKDHMPDRYLGSFSVPENGDSDMPGHFYSFDWGDVHFTVLDTSQVEEAQWIPNLFEKEKAWTEKDLQQTRKKWKVVLMHKDPLQYAFADSSRGPREEGFSDEGKAFMPIFDRNHVDLVLSAHLHTYRDRGKIYDFKRSSEGPTYVIIGLGGNVRYPSLWKQHVLDIYVAPQPETDNYIVFSADENQLLVTGYLPDGTELHETKIEK